MNHGMFQRRFYMGKMKADHTLRSLTESMGGQLLNLFLAQ